MEVELRISIHFCRKLFWRELGEQLSEVLLLPGVNVSPIFFNFDVVQDGLEIPLGAFVKNLVASIAFVIVRSRHQGLNCNPRGNSYDM